MSIGDNIKKLRTTHGLDQMEFGKIAGVSDKAVSSWENNNSVPRMGAIEKIATYFHIKKSEIIEDNQIESIKIAAYSPNTKEQKLISLIKEANLPNEKIDILIGMIESWK